MDTVDAVDTMVIRVGLLVFVDRLVIMVQRDLVAVDLALAVPVRVKMEVMVVSEQENEALVVVIRKNLKLQNRKKLKNSHKKSQRSQKSAGGISTSGDF